MKRAWNWLWSKHFSLWPLEWCTLVVADSNVQCTVEGGQGGFQHQAGSCAIGHIWSLSECLPLLCFWCVHTSPLSDSINRFFSASSVGRISERVLSDWLFSAINECTRGRWQWWQKGKGTFPVPETAAAWDTRYWDTGLAWHHFPSWSDVTHQEVDNKTLFSP